MASPTLQQQVNQIQLDDKRKEIRRKAERHLLHFDHLLRQKVARWRICARSIGSAYATAAANHRKALQDADKNNALNAQMLFSAITLVMSGGVSMVFSALALEEGHKVLGNLAKDLTMTVAGEAPSANGPPAVATLPKQTSDDAVDVEPLRYQNSMMNKVDAWEKEQVQFISDLDDAIDAAPLEKWDDFNELLFRTVIDRAWENLPLGMAENTDEKDVDAMARDLERGMWAKWMPRLKSVSRLTSGGDVYNWGYSEDVGKEITSYEGVKSPVEVRFKELNILSEAGLDGIHWYNSADSEDTKLISWANRYLAPGGHPVWNS
jgi:hypothetical protein